MVYNAFLITPFFYYLLSDTEAKDLAEAIRLSRTQVKLRECKIVCVKSNCADLFYAPYWGKQLKGWISNGKT